MQLASGCAISRGSGRWCNRDRRFDRQRGSLPEGTRVRGADVSGAEAVIHWRQGEAVWHQQARQLLSSQDPGAWSSSSGAAIEARPHRYGWMDDGAGNESPEKRIDRCDGEQTRADRLGSILERSGLPGFSRCGRCIGKVSQHDQRVFHQGMHRASEDQRTVTTAYRKSFQRPQREEISLLNQKRNPLVS